MEKLVILDCGGQYTKVIDRKVREAGVYSEIYPLGVELSKISDADAIILSGGPSSVWSAGAPKYDPRLFDLGKPILGICYGMQLITEHFGGTVKPSVKTEYGQTVIDVDTSCPLFAGLEPKQAVLMSHGDAVTKMPEGFTRVALTGEITAGIYDASRRIAGVQFHPEVDLTENGVSMLVHFLRDVCKLRETYALEDRIETSIRMIREKVGNENVIVLVSGGVDSAVTAALLLRALDPERVYAIHVDHGLMRKNESDIICEDLKTLGLRHLVRVNAEEQFFGETVDVGDGVMKGPLANVTDPEEKRQIIGSMFIRVTRDAADSLGLDFDRTFLAQGTLRPDLIESGNPLVSGYANKIKTHHNDVDIVRRARERGLIVETNWDWHKDEVRQVARMLGLSEEVASRQPFPGPGLGVRMICTEGAEKVTSEQSKRLTETIEKNAPAFRGAIAPIRSVGVQGDNRSYRSLAVLSEEGEDAGLANAFEIARIIPNTLDYINRVALRVDGGKVGESLYCSPMHVCHDNAELLREIDAIVMDTVMNKGISQCFAVLIPVSSENNGKYSAVIRAVVTSDFMTARPALPGKDFAESALAEAARRIQDGFSDRIDMVLYDVTGKPPATIEWE